MATRNIVPRADLEGKIGTETKKWGGINAKNINGTTLTAETINGTTPMVTPNLYNADTNFTAGTQTTILTPNICKININNAEYAIKAQQTLDISTATLWDDNTYATAASRAGKNFYIYALAPATGLTPALLLSANSTVPNSHTANDSRKIGGFHCLCADVGNTGDTNHPLNNYVAGDILPNSIWDLSHRPKSDPEGMAYVPGLDKWFDIYLSSWNDTKLVSAFNAVIADGASAPKWHGEKFAEQFGLQKKSLMWRDEFIVLAKGSNEETSIKGSADPNTTGGHVDTANRRMISYYGHEDCCGTMWQWVKDTFENYPGSTWNTANQYLDNYTWQKAPIYAATVDSRSYGSANGLLRRAIVGASWSDGAYCGSRAVVCRDFSAYVYANIAARGASEPL